MAFTISFAMAGSLVLTMTLIPVLAALLLKPKEVRETWLVRGIKSSYVGILAWSLKHRKVVIATAASMILGSLAIFPFLGKEFMPQLERSQDFLESY